MKDATPIPNDASELGRTLDGYRVRLRRMIELRMDPRVRARIDASDVLQETFVEVTQRLPEYHARPKMPFFLWVRFLAGQRLLRLHRDHLGTGKRDARLEARGGAGGAPEASSFCLASALVDSGVLTPAQGVMQVERVEQLQAALDQLSATDREVLVLRHFEHLTNREVAQVLELSEPGASLRYSRAAQRFREVLKGFLPGSES